jgi:hypothetical protein
MTAGIELSEYFMPGLGGRELSAEHAVESAAVLVAVNPTFICIRSTVPVPGTPLYRMMMEGRWMTLTEEEKVREIRACLERLDGITSTVQILRRYSRVRKVERFRERQIGLVRIQGDHYVLRGAGDAEGRLRARVVTLDASRLTVNADASKGSLRAQVSGLAGRPLPGVRLLTVA